MLRRVISQNEHGWCPIVGRGGRAMSLRVSWLPIDGLGGSSGETGVCATTRKEQYVCARFSPRLRLSRR